MCFTFIIVSLSHVFSNFHRVFMNSFSYVSYKRSRHVKVYNVHLCISWKLERDHYIHIHRAYLYFHM